MGLKDFFDDIIPNELKGSLGTVAAVAGAAYLGYKYAPSAYSAAKGFIGQPAMTGAPYAKGTGLHGWIDKTAAKYPKTAKFVTGFGQQVAGKALEGESEADAKKRFAEEQARINQMMKAKQYSIPNVSSSYQVGTFQSTRAPQVPGFKNPHVNESLNMMAYFMQDLNDNGRIDSSALYAEAPRGVTIGLPSAKSMKMSI
jgi:hypothetical protein